MTDHTVGVSENWCDHHTAFLTVHRVRTVTVDKIMEEQAGFKRGRGCAEQIFVMRQLTEKMIEKGKKL